MFAVFVMNGLGGKMNRPIFKPISYKATEKNKTLEEFIENKPHKKRSKKKEED